MRPLARCGAARRAAQAAEEHRRTERRLDGRIWFRNHQAVWAEEKSKEPPTLVEVGPRMVMNPIRIFAGSFRGQARDLCTAPPPPARATAAPLRLARPGAAAGAEGGFGVRNPQVLWSNPNYVDPNSVRRSLKDRGGGTYKHKVGPAPDPRPLSILRRSPTCRPVCW